MIPADFSHRKLVLDILTPAFADNKSVNYVVKNDRRKEGRVRALMAYSFDMCYTFGEVWLSDDMQACALLLFAEQQKTSLKTILWDARLAVNSFGLNRIGRVLKRESRIKQHHPASGYVYLWFVGVAPGQQGKGLGSTLMQEVLQKYDTQQLPLYLETSTLRNLPWYEQLGFEIYNELDFSFTLYMLRRESALKS